MTLDAFVVRDLFSWWKRIPLRWFWCDGSYLGHDYDAHWRGREDKDPMPVWLMRWCYRCGRCNEAHFTVDQAEL
jgi:hypothetical protein